MKTELSTNSEVNLNGPQTGQNLSFSGFFQTSLISDVTFGQTTFRQRGLNESSATEVYTTLQVLILSGQRFKQSDKGTNISIMNA